MIIMIVILCLREQILSGSHWLVLTIDWIMGGEAGYFLVQNLPNQLDIQTI